MAEVLCYVGGAAFIWFIFYLVTSWIYNTKEARVDKNYEAYLKKANKNAKVEIVNRVVGGYQVECQGLFRQDCKVLK